MKTKKIKVEGYGEVEFKKYNFADRCLLKGKIAKVSLNPITKIEQTEIDTGAMFFWTLVLSLKSLPGHSNFHQLDEAKKVDIVAHLGDGDDEPDDLGEVLVKEAQDFNKLKPQEIKKKSS